MNIADYAAVNSGAGVWLRCTVQTCRHCAHRRYSVDEVA
jgi:hypothetical protein